MCEETIEKVCQLETKTIPEEACEIVKVTKCSPITRNVCQIVTQQRCTTITEEVPFEVCAHSRPENLKKSRPKKLVEINFF